MREKIVTKEKNDMAWKIIAKRSPILGGIAGHLFFDILDDNGNRKHHIHGFPTDTNGNAQEFSLSDSTDAINVYVLQPNNKYLGIYDSVQLYSGTQANVETALKDIKAAQNFINAQDFSYEALHGDVNDSNGFGGSAYNSNSVFNTLLNVFRKTFPITNADAALTLGGGVGNPGSKG